MAIDAYKALARNALKKTGDQLIAAANGALGTIGLLRDPVTNLEAATKQYVDTQIAIASGGAQVPNPLLLFRSGSFYGPSWAYNNAQLSFITTSGSPPSLIASGKAACLALYLNKPGTRYKRIDMSQTNAASVTYRLGIYALDATTLLPTSVILDAGTVVSAGSGGTYSINIDVTITQSLIGLCLFLESAPPYSGGINPGIIGWARNVSTQFPYYPGGSGTATTLAGVWTLRTTVEGGETPGALPPIGHYAWFNYDTATRNEAQEPVVRLQVF